MTFNVAERARVHDRAQPVAEHGGADVRQAPRMLNPCAGRGVRTLQRVRGCAEHRPRIGGRSRLASLSTLERPEMIREPDDDGPNGGEVGTVGMSPPRT